MPWEWVAPTVTGTIAMATIGVTSRADAVRRRREDALHAKVDDAKDLEDQRAIASEAIRMLDVIDAVVREHWDASASRAGAVPVFKLAWPVADLLRAVARLKVHEVRRRVEDGVELVRLHRHAEVGDTPPSAVVLGVTEEIRVVLARWLRGEPLPEPSAVFVRLLAVLRERAANDIVQVTAATRADGAPAVDDLDGFDRTDVALWFRPMQAQW